MSTRLNIIRKTKWLFIRYRLHRLVEPFSGFLINLAQLSRLSKWAAGVRDVPVNDFYSPRWNYDKRYGLYEEIYRGKGLDQAITYLEFGVSGGHSFAWWVKRNADPRSRFTGFDTFEGLPEDWGGFRKGAMSTHSSLPAIDDPRVDFRRGLFQETLPGFLKTIETDRPKVIMMDADLYSSTLYVLTSLAPYLKKGDIVFFDQYNVPTGEFLAFRNFVESYYLNFRLLGAANNYYFCAFELE